MISSIFNVLSIAGSDPSGGAGIQADLKTFAACECYGMAAVAALTVQNTCGVRAIHVPPAAFLGAQIDAIFDDIKVDAVKIGMLADAESVALVAARLAFWRAPHIVLDPVFAATSGDALTADDVAEAMIAFLFPLAELVTPNLAEAARLAGLPTLDNLEKIREAGAALCKKGAQAVLIKGGHRQGPCADDVLYSSGGERVFSAPRIATHNAHGTGCTLSSAIAAELAKGASLATAIARAKDYVTEALRHADLLRVGAGGGPLHHFHRSW